jgi:hypothetical protein
MERGARPGLTPPPSLALDYSHPEFAIELVSQGDVVFSRSYAHLRSQGFVT